MTSPAAVEEHDSFKSLLALSSLASRTTIAMRVGITTVSLHVELASVGIVLSSENHSSANDIYSTQQPRWFQRGLLPHEHERSIRDTYIVTGLAFKSFPESIQQAQGHSTLHQNT